MVQNRTLNHTFLIPLFLFLALLLDGVLMNVFSSHFINPHYMLTPRLLLLVLVMFTVFFPKQPLFLYALLFGIIYDSFYSGILGLYAAGLAIIIYLLKKAQNHLNPSPLVMLPVYTGTIICLETFIYAMYSFIGLHTISFGTFLVQRMGPTILLNIVFFVVCYFPFYKLSQWMYD